MERDAFVKLDDPIEGGLPHQRDERSADGENENGNVEVKDQSGRSGYRICNPKRCSSIAHIIFHMIIYEAKCKYHAVNNGKHEQEKMLGALVG